MDLENLLSIFTDDAKFDVEYDVLISDGFSENEQAVDKEKVFELYENYKNFVQDSIFLEDFESSNFGVYVHIGTETLAKIIDTGLEQKNPSEG